jgi:plasmid rolling circle replication initiator protein Rep
VPIISLSSLFYQADKYKRLLKAKRFTFPVIEHYSFSDNENYQKYAERMLNCSNQLKVRIMISDDITEFTRTSIEDARWCHVRQCPMCQFARVSRQRGKFFKTFVPAEVIGKEFGFLTLTVRNRPLSQLRQTLLEMTKAWDKFCKRRNLPFVGFLRSMEVTIQRDKNGAAVRSPEGELMAHPHFHILLEFRDGYFEEGFKDKNWWILQWQSSLGVDYLPSVDIRKIRPIEGDISKGVLEVLKYTVKPSDFCGYPESAEWLYGLTEQLHRLRSLRSGGTFAKLCPQEELDAVDDLSTEGLHSQCGDLLLLSWNHIKNYWDVDETSTS